MKAVMRLREAGYTVNLILALVDRQQGGAQLYQEHDLDFHSLFTIEDLKSRQQELKKAQD